MSTQKPQGLMKGQPIVPQAALSSEEIAFCTVLARIVFRCLKEGNPRVLARFAQARLFLEGEVSQEIVFREEVS